MEIQINCAFKKVSGKQASIMGHEVTEANTLL